MPCKNINFYVINKGCYNLLQNWRYKHVEGMNWQKRNPGLGKLDTFGQLDDIVGYCLHEYYSDCCPLTSLL